MMILAMIGFSIAVIVICAGLLGFLMGGFKFADEGRHRRRQNAA